ncbi:glycosyltransferase family 1 protein [Leptolyngbya cf. ectocarpi LEGE 11479]|uniref:Glycosyltransferase family 1 protein n=1 Tax=Leptolyngbya cf. ectocarpi LEGE 11479 TaxID=1828722 RepID=A0A928ZZI8_LEPEC|nr:glycosyltransferase [Leptolyngbya ectocarpi]MBE9070382.1 glycosyltransferase family 1 protein [Leptolyngbya cf. ectocarpi LEGE 11479]
MSRIVLTTIGSFGDLHPKIAIALELRRRGHDIVFATHREYQHKIEALGFEFHRMRPDNTALNDPEEMARMMDLRTGTEYVVRNWVCASLRETYTDLMNTAKNADLIINGEGVLAARLVAEKLGISWIPTVLQPLSFLSAYDPSVLPALPAIFQLPGFNLIAQRGIRPLSKLLSKAWAKPVYQLRQEIDLPPLKGNPLIDDKYPPGLVLTMFSPVLAKPQPDWPTNTVLTGFTFYDGSEGGRQLPSELEQFLNAGEPPIVFTLGSAAVVSPGQFYEESIKAVNHLNRRAVLLMGKNAPPANLPNSIIAVNYAPYSQLFSRACAIVHQGGVGTTAQALRAGRPTLVTPYSVDQPDNAARVKRLGTSRTVSRKQYIAKRVAKQLNELLDNPNYAARSIKIGAIIRAENGVNVACDAIEKQLKAV